MKVTVVGLGKVGLPFAAVTSKYYKVVGIDFNKEWVAKLKSNVLLTEPYLNTYLKKYPFNITTDFNQVHDTDIVFVVVGSQREEYSVNSVLRALEMVSPYLTSGEQVIVIMSTLRPGSMRKAILPFLKRKKLSYKIKGICYNPVFVALGSAIEYFNNPEFVVIGESNPEAGIVLEDFYKKISPTSKFYHSNIENVEVLKFALNLALINKISLLNTLTEFCEKYGADIDFVTEVLKQDSRIAGIKMFRGGLGFGGTCFPVDARSIKKSQIKKNLDTFLIDAIIKINERQIQRTVQLIKSMKENKISVLGVTYKPNVDLSTESQALEIVKRLAKVKDVLIYDPKGMKNARKELGSEVRYANTLNEALNFGDIILITVEWPQFAKINKEDLKTHQIVIDPWRLLRTKDLNIKYITFGVG